MKLADLFIKLGLKKDGFDRGIDGAKQKTNAFSSAVKKIGGIMAGAFAVERIFSFGKELLELGGIAEGVESAFKRIAGVNTLNDLKDATRGTVSELELMKRAVSAQNLGLPVENLASLFEFATKRAQDTGESVDYLVNSIVTGIGRKSPLILDNLGISAIQLREKLKGVGMESASVAEVAAAVGEIASDSMRESGEIIETNAIKVQKLKAGWDDLKKSIATSDTVVRYFSDQLDGISIMAKVLTSDQISGWEKLRSTLFDNKEEARKLGDELEKIAKTNKQGLGVADSPKPFDGIGKSLDDILPKWEKQGTYLEALQILLKENKNDLDKLMQTGGKFHGEKSAEDFIKKVDELKKKIDELEKKIKTATFSRDETSMTSISSRGTSQDELSALIPDLAVPDTSTLDSLDNFRNKLNEKYANLIDDETLSKMNEQFLSDFSSAFITGISDMLTQVSSALGEAIAGGGWDNFGKAVLQSIGGFLQQMGGLMIAYGVFMALFDKAIKAGPIGWPLAIAAGIGLVAAGAAISSLASGGVSGASTGYSGATSSSNSSSAAINGDVRFVLEGDKLVGAIDNSRSRRRLTS